MTNKNCHLNSFFRWPDNQTHKKHDVYNLTQCLIILYDVYIKIILGPPALRKSEKEGGRRPTEPSRIAKRLLLHKTYPLDFLVNLKKDPDVSNNLV